MENCRQNAKRFAEAFIKGEPLSSLEEIAMTIPREEWSLCFDNWCHDVKAGLYESGVKSEDLVRLIAKVGYDLSSNKPVQIKVRMTNDIPVLYSHEDIPSICQDELAGVYSSLL